MLGMGIRVGCSASDSDELSYLDGGDAFTAYVAVTVLTAVANLLSAYLDFVRHERVVVAMRRGRVLLSWMAPLGVLKAAGVWRRSTT